MLLITFQDQEFRGNTGLSLLQFRYVLEKGYKNTKTSNTQIKNNIRDCKKFYGEHLKQLIDQGLVTHECINTKQAVMKHLLTLQSSVKGLEHIKHRYHLKPKFYFEYFKLMNKKSIDFYPLNQMLCIHYEYGFHTLYGVPERLISKKDWVTIEENLQQIDKILDKIKNIKDKSVADECIKRLNQWIKTTKSDKVIRLIQDYGNLLCDDLLLYVVHKEDYTKILEKQQDWSWSEIHFGKEHNFSQSEIDEIKNWWVTNQDILLQQRPMSYAKFY